ncbi:hypothetical protein [Allorhizocola rhizosphaerae]|uniref:hypothetical protein n=1 Tax=Allorhizocola rhizosphaerae TaxID=1872709 RepID=UPI0013C2E917|nr:hypothetical protein [Allorhizocola rhizosphaerae]
MPINETRARERDDNAGATAGGCNCNCNCNGGTDPEELRREAQYLMGELSRVLPRLDQ